MTVVEKSLSDREEAYLSKSGLLSLVHRRNTDKAAFVGGQSLFRPDAAPPQMDVETNMRARLPYTMPMLQFVRALRCMARDRIGSALEMSALQETLQQWINQFVGADPETSSEAEKARRPLREADITIEEDEAVGTGYRLILRIVPTFQMEGVDVSTTHSFAIPLQ